MANKSLVIVESPAKAKTINGYLGSDYIVKSSIGHIVDLASSGKSNLGVDIENDFKPKYEVMPDKKDAIKAIVKAASQCDEIILASDPDREGEAIAFHLKEILKKSKKPMKRVTFQEITKKGIKAGIENPVGFNEDLYNAQQARRILDRIVGFLVSPYLSKKIEPRLSAGRVQSPVVRLIVDREREIESFKPDEYWTITAELSKDKQNFTAKYNNKVTDKKTAQAVKSDLEQDDYIVKNLVEEEKKKNPYPPFTTSSLAQAAAGKFRFSAERTMKAAQSLYESGKITYIRTDSTRIATDAIQDCRAWIEENGYDLPKKPNTYTTKGAAQDAHEAIRPTDVALTSQNIFGAPDEQALYALIWERFVACQMNPALYDNVAATIKTTSGHELKAYGRTLKYKGWLEVTSDLENKDSDITLPVLKKSDKLALVPPKVKALQKFTKPPSRFTDKTMIAELEKRGIGRPSTLASLMARITSKGYVEKKGNAYIPTKKGMKVIDELTKFFEFLDYNYTADMENQLDKIAEGNLNWTKMLRGFYDPFKKNLKEAYLSSHKDYGFVCDKCNSKMVLRHGSFGFFMACMDYPTCKNTISVDMVDDKPIVRASKLTPPAQGVSCPNCNSDMVKRDGKFGPFYSCVEYPKCKGTRKVPFGKKCPKCGDELYATIYKEENLLFCMGYPNCKHSEKMPEGKLPDPKKLVGEKIPKKIEKILKK